MAPAVEPLRGPPPPLSGHQPDAHAAQAGVSTSATEPTLLEAKAILERMAVAARAGEVLRSRGGTPGGLPMYPHDPSPAASETIAGPPSSPLWAAELRYRALIEKIPAVTFMAALDENVHELYVSPQIQSMLGYTQEEWLNDPFLWFNRLHPDDRERWQGEFARTCATGVQFKSQYRFFARDGRVVWVQGEAQVIHDEHGRPLFLQGIAFDITEIKRAEEALHRMHEQLETMVEQRTAELARANELLVTQAAERLRLQLEVEARNAQLAEESERKDHFLAVLAHELRNPLAPMSMALEVIRAGAVSPEDRDWAHGMMERQVGQMSRLIDDLLDISRISRGKVELRREIVDLCTITRNAMETARPRIEERRHHLASELPHTPILVDGDPVRLEQIVVNLLTNAAKFTDPGGRIRVSVGAEGGLAVIRVSDTGAGIPADMLEKIFELFAQVDRSTSRNNQWGLGIGLALVRGLAELHGGTAEAYSEGPGHGSEFAVRLPLSTPAPVGNTDLLDAPPTVVAGMPPLPARTILVVDDNQEFASSLALLLNSWGQHVVAVSSGDEAIVSANVHTPDIVFLDLGMPGKDGLQVARELRAAPEPVCHATIVALTGYGRTEDRQRTREAGFDQHLTKPVPAAALHALLARLVDEPARGGARP